MHDTSPSVVAGASGTIGGATGVVAVTYEQAGATASLALIVISAVLFTVGWRLAVRKRFEAHRRVQTVAVCLNAAVVLAWMIRPLIIYVIPAIPAKIHQVSYATTTVHAVIGFSGLAFGVFVALRGNELVPKAWRFTNYKPYMRAAYALYMLGTLTGIVTYTAIYVA